MVKARNIGLFLASRPGKKVKNVADNKFGMRGHCSAPGTLSIPPFTLIFLFFSRKLSYSIVFFLVFSKLWIFSRECYISRPFTTFPTIFWMVMVSHRTLLTFSILILKFLPSLTCQCYCYSGNFLDFSFFMYVIQHCRPSDSTVSEDAGIELWHWQPDALTTRLDIIKARLDLIHNHLLSQLSFYPRFYAERMGGFIVFNFAHFFYFRTIFYCFRQVAAVSWSPPLKFWKLLFQSQIPSTSPSSLFLSTFLYFF